MRTSPPGLASAGPAPSARMAPTKASREWPRLAAASSPAPATLAAAPLGRHPPPPEPPTNATTPAPAHWLQQLLCVRARSYQPSTGKTACIACPRGTYNEESMSSSPEACLKCRPGTYANFTGADVCNDCDGGYYQDQEGQTSCKVGGWVVVSVRLGEEAGLGLCICARWSLAAARQEHSLPVGSVRPAASHAPRGPFSCPCRRARPAPTAPRAPARPQHARWATSLRGCSPTAPSARRAGPATETPPHATPARQVRRRAPTLAAAPAVKCARLPPLLRECHLHGARPAAQSASLLTHGGCGGCAGSSCAAQAQAASALCSPGTYVYKNATTAKVACLPCPRNVRPRLPPPVPAAGCWMRHPGSDGQGLPWSWALHLCSCCPPLCAALLCCRHTRRALARRGAPHAPPTCGLAARQAR